MGKTILARCLSGLLAADRMLIWTGTALRAMPRADHARLVQAVGQRPHLQLSGRPVLCAKRWLAAGKPWPAGRGNPGADR
ncbi:hypothetical protein [Pseudogemmobacter bohemicus]|uniref:hypothetical protein n=1 Tax=Pseudogemmobacter bohemicus TaxID=2250708 RepID=UPI0013007B8C|nr:hypothetical protein [Pseudogemmobacter bohemicus]